MISFDAKHAEYEDLFEPEGYLQSCYGLGPGYGKEPRELSDINREVRFKMTTTPRYLDQCLMHKGDQLSYLELSVGPYVYNMVHAASKEQIAHIDCTDFCSNNLQYLEKVIEDPTVSKFDWDNFIKVASHGRMNSESLRILRKKLGKLQKLDFQNLAEVVLPQASYDVIVAEYCLAESCKDKDDYTKILHFINRSLVENGSFLLVELLEQTYWKTYDKSGNLNQLAHVSVTYDWLIEAIKNAGFLIEETSCLLFPKRPQEFFDAKGNVSIWATKVSQI